MKTLTNAELFAIVDEIREHLIVPGQSPRRWEIPSETKDARRTVSIVASSDLGEQGDDYMRAFHLSLAGWLDGEQVTLPDDDLHGLVPLILDFLAPFAAVRGGGSNPFVKDDFQAVHVWVYFADIMCGEPMRPTGSFAVTPWAA
ncbi:hypothetical protein GUY44_11815 [Pimelobacter simplex]|nr:hypothetical protein [Pimelobacter simplex]MCG8151168.1 hypothetical protein [Pimelobacter simplex]SFM98250.1 hypothetical protein SAMN05421671_4526 [Pimelobacter simplex]